MSRREKDKQASLDALAKIAYAAGGGAPAAPAKAAPPASSLPRAPAKPSPKPAAPKRTTPVELEAEKRRRQQMEERKAKLEEERALKQRRSNELARANRLERRGMDDMNVPASIRRTGYDVVEPTVAQKLHDILGEARIKDSREKMRDKGRRQGGR